MSYNITNWKTIEIKNLEIAVKDFNEVNQTLRKDWQLDLTQVSWTDDEVTITGGAKGFELVGEPFEKHHKSYINVTFLCNYGEGSGTWFTNFLCPLLFRSTGTLKIRLIWEGGDTVEKNTWVNGVLTSVDMDVE